MRTILTVIFCVYANLLLSQTNDSSLNRFIYDWIDVPYKWGGNTKKGIDCSQLNKVLHKQIYKVDIANTCREQFASTIRVKKQDLEVGDLVFFYSKRSPSGWHCGTYIGDNKFFHASNSRTDIIISDLNESYYVNRFRGGGRITKK